MSADRIDPNSRLAGRLVLGWVGVYTMNVSRRAAEQRQAELVSDVWEQVNDAELMGLAAGPWLVWRAIRGVPADLAWRRSAQAEGEGERAAVHLLWERIGLLGVSLIEALLVGGLLLGTIVHILHGGGAGSLGSSMLSVLAALTAGVLFTVTGVALLLRIRTRPLAPLALGVATLILLMTALPALEWISTTVSAFYNTSPLLWTHPGWSEARAAAVALACVFHSAVALAWLPRSGRTMIKEA